MTNGEIKSYSHMALNFGGNLPHFGEAAIVAFEELALKPQNSPRPGEFLQYFPKILL